MGVQVLGLLPCVNSATLSYDGAYGGSREKHLIRKRSQEQPDVVAKSDLHLIHPLQVTQADFDGSGVADDGDLPCMITSLLMPN